MGVTTIKSTIISILRSKSSDLKSTLTDIVAAQAANIASGDHAFWKAADSSSLSFFDLVDFVIQPHVVKCLIMEDLKTDETNAEDIRLKSYAYGLEFNKEDDEFADRVLEHVRGRFTIMDEVCFMVFVRDCHG